MNISVQPNVQQTSFKGNRLSQAKQILKTMKKNNNTYFKPNRADKYARFQADSPTHTFGFVMAQLDNLEKLVNVLFTRRAK